MISKSPKLKQVDVKLITNSEEIVQMDNINYSQLQGHQPPLNTPLTPGHKSPWNNIIIDDSCQYTWNNTLYQFQDYVIKDSQTPQNTQDTQNTYNRALLKEMMKLDFSNTQAVNRIKQLRFRQCILELNQSEFFNQQNSIKEPQNSKQQPRLQKQQQQFQQQQKPQNFLVRYVDDPYIKQKKDEMLEQQKWLSIQLKTGSVEGEFTKDLKFKLNQLAPQNYKLISSQVLNIVMKNTELQMAAIEYIIEKGALEDKYRVIYAKLIHQILEKVENPQQIKSKIKQILINILSPPDYGKISDDTKNLIDNELLIFQTKRKKKFIGYNKLIATLFNENIFDYKFIDLAFTTNTRSYVTQHNMKDKTPEQKRISEEPIEAIMALLQVCGRDYISELASQDLTQFLDQLSRKQQPDEIVHLSQDGLIQMIDCLIKNYHITQRVTILLQNLREEVDNKFSGQSRKAKKYVESSDDEDYTTEQVSAPKQQQQAPLLHIIEDEDDQLLSSKKPLTDKEIILILDQGFKSSVNLLAVLQTKVINRITSESHWSLFWKTFFNNLLDINQANMLRVHFAYQIFEQNQVFCSADNVMIELNDVLQMKVFDIVESPYGLDFLSKLIRPFIINQLSSILQLKLEEQQEELQSFYIQLVARVVTQEQLQTDTNIQTVSELFVNNLMLSVEQQQIMWESIK